MRLALSLRSGLNQGVTGFLSSHSFSCPGGLLAKLLGSRKETWQKPTLNLGERDIWGIAKLDEGASFLQPWDDFDDFDRQSVWKGFSDEANGIDEAERRALEALQEISSLFWTPQ
jgi:hypothetical protein